MKAGLKSGSLRTSTALALVATLGGCVSRDMTDLENYVAEVLARKGGAIEKIPAIKVYEHYLYQAQTNGLRDPFESFFEEKPDKEKVTASQDPGQQKITDEIQTHNREELEGYELDALRMVGILERNEDMWAIVKDQAGTVHRVQVGNYLGRNFGKITNIQEDRVDIREIIKDAQGRWEERAATLALSEE